MAGLLSIERHDEVALVTLRRPEQRNALSIELRMEIADAFGRLCRDSEVGCVVLTGAGAAFCSGMDTTQFGGDLEHRRQLVETSTVAFEAVGGCRRPIVAAINGPAIAGGFALALLCDLRIASASAIFGYPELPRGIPPSYAAARAVLPATVAQELCLTGELVKAEEAQRMGSSARSSRATWWREGSSSLGGSQGCRARQCSRPSAARCSSAGTCGGSCSRTSNKCSGAPCWVPRRSPSQGERRSGLGAYAIGDTASRICGQT